MAGTMAVYGFLFLGILGVGINAGITCDDGVGGSVDCKVACCNFNCCLEVHDQGYDIGTIIGISMGILLIKSLFWGCCIYAIRTRHRNTLMVRQAQSASVQFTNPAHAGYIQPGGTVPMNPPPYAGPVVEDAPPAYDA